MTITYERCESVRPLLMAGLQVSETDWNYIGIVDNVEAGYALKVIVTNVNDFAEVNNLVVEGVPVIAELKISNEK